MSPADFTLDFFKLCLSQHRWDWRKLTDTFERQKHSANEDFLLHIAYSNGQQFIDAFNAVCPQQTFPFNTEKPNTKPNTIPMQLTINIPEFAQLAEAINRLTENLNNPAPPAPAVTATVSTSGGETEAPATTKKRGRPAKAEATPAPAAEPDLRQDAEPALEPAAPETPAPQPEPETAPALPELSGADLARKASDIFSGEDPLRVEMRKRLVDYRTKELGWDQPISKLTDQAMLYQFNEKIDELADELALRESQAKNEI